MVYQQPAGDEPCYVISVVARLVGVNVQTLRYYERAGLVEPSRSGGNIRLYSPRDVERIRRIKALMNDMVLNLAGAEVALRLMERIGELEAQLQEAQAELQQLRAASHGETSKDNPG